MRFISNIKSFGFYCRQNYNIWIAQKFISIWNFAICAHNFKEKKIFTVTCCLVESSVKRWLFMPIESWRFKIEDESYILSLEMCRYTKTRAHFGSCVCSFCVKLQIMDESTLPLSICIKHSPPRKKKTQRNIKQIMRLAYCLLLFAPHILKCDILNAHVIIMFFDNLYLNEWVNCGSHQNPG